MRKGRPKRTDALQSTHSGIQREAPTRRLWAFGAGLQRKTQCNDTGSAMRSRVRKREESEFTSRGSLTQRPPVQ
jgi:hypothetical protein